MGIGGYVRYFLSILEHKRRVLILCWQRGRYMQGLTHDLSKLLPDEFFASAHVWVALPMTPLQTERAQFGLLKHYHRNPHHPEHWILRPGQVLEMPQRYLLEMLCDWQA